MNHSRSLRCAVRHLLMKEVEKDATIHLDYFCSTAYSPDVGLLHGGQITSEGEPLLSREVRVKSVYIEASLFQSMKVIRGGS